VTLSVCTARISYRGTDRLDVSRKGHDPLGVVFAPSWSLIKPLIEQRRAGFPLTDAGWQDYVTRYTQEMRASYVQHREEWYELLTREEVTLCCYCTDATRCHRTVLAGILSRLGATVLGER
jgi:uncharacterized protein YeaO (DUF488 family)